MSGELSIIRETFENYDVSTQVTVFEDFLKITMKGDEIEAQAVIDIDFDELLERIKEREAEDGQ